MRLAIILLLVSLSTFADPHPIHYVKTHKVVILADLLDIGSMYAESYTSIQCLKAMKTAGVVTSGCAKQGWEGLDRLAPLEVVANHLTWHLAPDHASKYIFNYWTAPTVTMGVRFGLVNDSNADVQYLQEKYPTRFVLTRK